MGGSESERDTGRLGERPDFEEWVGDVMSALETRRAGESVSPPGRLRRYRLLFALAAKRLIRRRPTAA